MPDESVRVLMLNEEDGKINVRLSEVAESDLPEGDVTVAVDYSTLNYKDGMILQGKGRLVKNYPHVPGVDFSGTVEKSLSDKFKIGDRVVLNGWRVGEIRWGGFASKARVKSDWLVKLPNNISNREAMGIGTAGYTAMLAVMALENHGVGPNSGDEVIVSGAGGGVGSISVLLLAGLGYNVVASTGRNELHDYLKELGARVIIDRSELEASREGPISSGRWAGAIDNVGGVVLSNILASIKPGGSCAAVGNTGSNDLETSIIPFLLRGINLLGIDSVMCPMEKRIRAWALLSDILDFNKLAKVSQLVPLSEIYSFSNNILKGEIRGRVIVDIGG
ncbi:MAG: MDR family oxidoreductase [Pseudomonadota bacterium]|nr:MDR family oxidoreductase [Pseudomonadota bacterium]